MLERIQLAFGYVPSEIVNDVFWACVIPFSFEEDGGGSGKLPWLL